VLGILERSRPDDKLRITYIDRTGTEKQTTVVLKEDPHVEVRPVEAVGGTVTSAQHAFRDRWLSGR